MITKEQFDAWLVALRSGEYKQGIGKLCVLDEDANEELHCCLGVLAEVIGMDKDDRFAIREYAMPGESTSGSSGILPMRVLSDNVQSDLSNLNDNGHDFTFIANWIDCREGEIVGSPMVCKVELYGPRETEVSRV